MSAITYYLKDRNGRVVNKFEVTRVGTASIDGICYLAYVWDENHDSALEYQFVADVYCKWDSCTHWWFPGEDYDASIPDTKYDSYYHLCGSHCFTDHVRSMCFVWEVARQMLADDDTTDYYTSYNNPKMDELSELMLGDCTIEKQVDD